MFNIMPDREEEISEERMTAMIDFLSTYFVMDRTKTRIYSTTIHHNYDGKSYEIDLITDAVKFVEMKSIAITKAMENGTDLLDEIKLHDPENVQGFNELIY
ncbi:hypothetical protein J2Z32_001348 [Paenibacillus turicensis]|uniref:Uncharacterized protein n=1 Tax=Paenibacillus turicensis TaxID=160487 RepID=A0ABS4FQQ5_9BACL|nr:hypothetical protein [Paenibacillus turicensis]MBP1904724.1 hypothetical protein [Paenibacillus turicensis]